MSEKIESIILEVKLDTGQSAEKAAALKAEINSLKDANIALGKAEGDNSAAMEINNAKIKKATSEYNTLLGVMAKNETAVKASEGSYKQLSAQLAVVNDRWKSLSATERTNTDEGKLLTAQKLQLNNALKELDAQTGVNSRNVGNYTNSIAGLKIRLGELQGQIQTADFGSKEFKEAQDEAGKLTLKIGVLEGKLDSAGNREAKNPVKDSFDDSLQSATALASGIGVLSSVLGGNEDAQKKLALAVQAVAITQTAANILKAKDAILSTAQRIAIQLQTAAQWALNSATNAFVTLGVGALFTGVILAYNKLKGNVSGTADEQKRLNENTDDYINKIATLAPQTLNMNKLRKEDATTTAETLKVDRDALEVQKLLLEGQLNSMAAKEEKLAGGEREKKQIADEVEINKKLADINTDIAIIDRQITKSKEEKVKVIVKEKEAVMDLIGQLNKMWEAQSPPADQLAALKKWEEDYFENMNKQTKKTVILYDDMGEEIVNDRKELYDILGGAFDLHLDSEAAKLKAHNAEMTELISSLSQEIGYIFKESISETGLDLEKFAKGVTVLILDTLEKTIIAAEVKILADQIAAKGFIGIGTSAVLIALTTAAFEGAKALFSTQPETGFYEGGYTGEGNPKGESRKLGQRSYTYHNDEYVVPSKVLNDAQGSFLVSQLEKMRVNNPFKIGGFGKADGGFASNFSNSLRMQQGLTAKDLSAIKLWVSVTDINRVQGSVNVSDAVKTF